MSKEILEQLFDSPVKVRLLKLFLRNPEQSFEMGEITRRIRADSSSCKTQLNKLESIRFILSRAKGNKKSYTVNCAFDFYNELRILVLKSSPASKEKILSRIKGLGRINLVILSGVFVDAENARADLMVVGDNINQNRMNVFFKDLEAEVGREIDYVVLTTEEFKYRYDMFDRFIRDVLEKPHEKLVNRLKI